MHSRAAARAAHQKGSSVTVGRISRVCWAVFVVMSVAFLPLGLGVMSVHALPAPGGLAR